MQEYVIGITGASGSLYALRTAEALLELGCRLRLVLTQAGGQVLEHETGVQAAAWTAAHPGVILEDNANLFSAIASGSYRCAGMIIVPCSMSTAGRLASGVTTDLLTRAADVMLKQRRPLILVPRETPFTTIHLRNLLTLSECGAQILPAMPGFYNHPKSIDDLSAFLAGKILDCLGLENNLYLRWEDH